MKGITFKESMVRAIISGEKTRTARKERRFETGQTIAMYESWYADDDGKFIGYGADTSGDDATPGCIQPAYKLPLPYIRRVLNIVSIDKFHVGDIPTEWAIEEGTLLWAKENRIVGLNPQELFWRILSHIYGVGIEDTKFWDMYSIKFNVGCGKCL